MVNPASSGKALNLDAKAGGGIDGEDGSGPVGFTKMVQEPRPHPCGLQGHLEG
jgi:hypothetical protein